MKHLILLLAALLCACSGGGLPGDESVGSVAQPLCVAFDEETLTHWTVTMASYPAATCKPASPFLFTADLLCDTQFGPTCQWEWGGGAPKHCTQGVDQYIIGSWRCDFPTFTQHTSLTLLPNPTWNVYFFGGVTGTVTRKQVRKSDGATLCNRSWQVTAEP